jgi:hypothetical protein
MIFVGGHDRHSTKKSQRGVNPLGPSTGGGEEMEHLRPRFGPCSEIMTVMCRLWITPKGSEDQFADVPKPASNDYLQR